MIPPPPAGCLWQPMQCETNEQPVLPGTNNAAYCIVPPAAGQQGVGG